MIAQNYRTKHVIFLNTYTCLYIYLIYLSIYLSNLSVFPLFLPLHITLLYTSLYCHLPVLDAL